MKQASQAGVNFPMQPYSIPIRLISMKTFICLMLLLFSSLAHAYEDPQSLLPILDDFLGEPDFDTAFPEKQVLNIKNTSCINSFQKCDTFQTHTRTKRERSDEVSIEFYSGNNSKPGSVSHLKRSDWMRLHGNLVRYDIAQAESYGQKVKIISLEPIQANVIINGTIHNVRAMEMKLTIAGVANSTITHLYKITNEIPGIGQRIYKQVDNTLMGGSRDILELISSDQ